MYDAFIQDNAVHDFIENTVKEIDYENISDIEEKSAMLIASISNGKFSDTQHEEIAEQCVFMCKKYNQDNVDVAIRSSAIAEDLPNASFAGQQDTFLNVTGIYKVVSNIKKCFASLFNVRALSYRHSHNIPYEDVRATSAQPVNKFARFHILSPCRININSFVMQLDCVSIIIIRKIYMYAVMKYIYIYIRIIKFYAIQRF